jgi:PhzF family phenazine biosynthesis protein
VKLPIWQVDAFTGEVFRGNPAAVVVLDEPLPERVMQSIGAENNLSETAFVVRGEGAFGLRWFTPLVEVDLCGHATLASASVLFGEGMVEGEEATFETQSGRLTVVREGDSFVMDFPSRPPKPVEMTDAVREALGGNPREVHEMRGLMVVYETEEEIRGLRPDFGRIAAVNDFAVMVTAVGDEADFVSRFFAPMVGVPEDPVTGSAHCTLVPFWSRRLGKHVMRALQVSRRGGEIFCEDRGERVRLGGRAVLYLKGEIEIP